MRARQAIAHGILLAASLGALPGCPTDECGQAIGLPMRRSCPVQLREGLWELRQTPDSDSCERSGLEVGPDGAFEVTTGPDGDPVLDPMDGEAPFECGGLEGEFVCRRGDPAPLPGDATGGEVVARRTISLRFDVSTRFTGERAVSLDCKTPECDPRFFAEQAGVAQLPCSVVSTVRASFVED